MSLSAGQACNVLKPGDWGAAHDIDLARKAHELYFDRSRPNCSAASAKAFLELLDPRVVFLPDDDHPVPAQHTGVERVRQLLDRAAEEWDAYRFQAKEARALAPDRVMVAGRLFARGRGSDEAVELPFANVCTIRGGRIVRIEAVEAELGIEARCGRGAISGPVAAEPPSGRDWPTTSNGR